MRNFLTQWKREWSACFLSTTAYLTMIVFLAVCGWTFLWVLWKDEGTGEPLTVLLVISIAIWLPIAITAVTMGLFAEEKRAGTLETLMTAPVTEWQIVLGKYAGALSFLAVMVAPTATYLHLLGALGVRLDPIDPGAMLAGYGILLLLAAFGVAVGLLVSLLTRHQVISGILCFCVVCVPFLLGVLGRAAPVRWRPVLEYAATEYHLLEFARGTIDSRPIVLYLTGTVLALFLAVRVLESRRWT